MGIIQPEIALKIALKLMEPLLILKPSFVFKLVHPDILPIIPHVHVFNPLIVLKVL